jgi:hypothetical protein
LDLDVFEQPESTMDKIFELIVRPATGEGKKPEARIGIRFRLSSFETTCPMTRPCQSYPSLESEVQAIRQNLEDILKEGRSFFEGAAKRDNLGLRPDMTPGEIWAVLSTISEEGDFIHAFNSLEAGKRKELAEHVLTHCNVFAGKAAVFSSHYDDESALME